MSENIVTFHKTVRGYRHIQEEIPCQDSSSSYELNQEDGYQIICVADGHGDPACHRSDKGSKFVTEIAVKCLRDFAEAIISEDMPFGYPRQQVECMEQLTNTIISKWYGAVRNDLLENKVDEEDLQEAGRYEEAYRKGDKLEHLYGTTLIAALKVKDYLILIQQGDGRCDVFYADGTVNQPIPWDQRCKGSTTTSMCDKDVFNSIRRAVIDLSKTDVIACLMGSDGVEDSYFDNEETQTGTHRFYMELCCKLCEYGLVGFNAYLDEMLPRFSSTGSGDDVSVAGIVTLDKVIQYVDVFAEKVKRYDFEAKLKVDYEEAQSKVISMTRKHGILSSRVTDAQNILDDAQKAKQTCETELYNLKAQRDSYAVKVEQAKAELEEYQQESKTAADQLEGKFRNRSLTTTLQETFEKMTSVFTTKEATYEKMQKKLNEYDERIHTYEETLNSKETTIHELELKLETAKNEFAEYDERYRHNEAEKARLEKELMTLQGGN